MDFQSELLDINKPLYLRNEYAEYVRSVFITIFSECRMQLKALIATEDQSKQ